MTRFGGGVAVLATLGVAAVGVALAAKGDSEAPAGQACRVARPAAGAKAGGEEAAMGVTDVRAAAIPRIDAEAPAKTERATFALG